MLCAYCRKIDKIEISGGTQLVLFWGGVSTSPGTKYLLAPRCAWTVDATPSAVTRGYWLGKRWPPLPSPVMSSSRSSRLPPPSDVDPEIVVKYLEGLGVTPETTRAIRDEVRADDCCAALPPACPSGSWERRPRCAVEVPILLRSIVLHTSIWVLIFRQTKGLRRKTMMVCRCVERAECLLSKRWVCAVMPKALLCRSIADYAYVQKHIPSLKRTRVLACLLQVELRRFDERSRRTLG